MNSSSATRQVRINKKTIEATDICSLELVDVNGQNLPPFWAGAHIDVHLRGGLIRQYSLCNDPAENHRYLIAVLRDPLTRGGSKAMHELQMGDRVSISEPKNHFALIEPTSEANHSLLLAGGIGVTPILSMAEQLKARGAEFEMHYCTRSKERTAFLERIRESPFASKVQLHFDDGDTAQKLDLAARLSAPHPGTHLYVCGPKGFMDSVLATARGAGWSEDHLHYEFFSAEPVKTGGDKEFKVKIAGSGKIVLIPKNRTVTQALADAGIELPTSCEQGVCGTCVTKILEGIPDHRDMYLSPGEQASNTQFMPCCSRAKTPQLVLDL